MPLILGVLIFALMTPWPTEAWWHQWFDAGFWGFAAAMSLNYLRTCGDTAP